MAIWREAAKGDWESIVRMCLELYLEDPGDAPMTEDSVRRTLQTLHDEPIRGQAIVLESEERIVGYALLISFWSNELRGEVCTLDEIYVQPPLRGKGHATGLIRSLSQGQGPWTRHTTALELEVSPRNTRARLLYARLGFVDKKNSTLRLRLACSERRL